MSTFTFTSEVNARHYEDLEHLLFFNPKQKRVRTKIIEAIRKYGSPQIVQHGDKLRINVGGNADAQILFVSRETGDSSRLVGVVIFARENSESILVQHIAVHPEYSSSGKFAGEVLFFKIIEKLREISHSIKGVQYITLLYGSGVSQRIRV